MQKSRKYEMWIDVVKGLAIGGGNGSACERHIVY